MPMKLIQVPVPDRLLRRFGGESGAVARVSQAAVLELLREGEMTSGEAAEVLGVTRREVLTLMAEKNVPIANYDAAELADELDTLRRLTGSLKA
jgi:predicted HTH domain antitoxin